MKRIPFNDLIGQYQQIKSEIDKAIKPVLNSGWFILGKEVHYFEKEFAGYIGTKYAVGVASGTEAIALALMACGIGDGDEVITVPNTAVPTVSAISMANARPIFIDIDKKTYLIDPEKIQKSITKRTKAVIPVHLYGQTAKMDIINEIAKANNLWVIEDACQAHGSEYKNKKAGAWGDLGCFSFYPTKNLSCYGDGGLVTTNNKILYKKLLMLRNYGQQDRYRHIIIGINSRLDEMQAAVLRIKLKYLDKWNAKRRIVAKRYYQFINSKFVITPFEDSNGRHIYHLFVIRAKKRNLLQKALHEKGIETLIHYPIPVHLQRAYQWIGYKKDDFPYAENCAKEILSLPIYPGLSESEINYISETINDFYKKGG